MSQNYWNIDPKVALEIYTPTSCSKCCSHNQYLRSAVDFYTWGLKILQGQGFLSLSGSPLLACTAFWGRSSSRRPVWICQATIHGPFHRTAWHYQVRFVSTAMKPPLCLLFPKLTKPSSTLHPATLTGHEDGGSVFGSTARPFFVWSANLLRVHSSSSYQLQLITLE